MALVLAFCFSLASVPTPARLPADVDDVYSLRYNPAGLADLRGAELRLLYGRRIYDPQSGTDGSNGFAAYGGVSLVDGLSLGASVEVDHFAASLDSDLGSVDLAASGSTGLDGVRPLGGTTNRFGIGLGARAGAFRFGLAWERGREDVADRPLGVWTAGLALRPTSWLSTGLAVRDLAQHGARRTYDIGLAFRPFGERATLSTRWRLTQSRPIDLDDLDIAFLASFEPLDGLTVGIASDLDLEVTGQVSISFDHLWLGASVTDADPKDVGHVPADARRRRPGLDVELSTELAYFSRSTPAILEPSRIALVELEGDLEPDPAFSLSRRGFVSGAYGSAPLLLERLRSSERVAGVLIKVSALSIGWAKAEELRAGIVALRQTGKRVDCLLGSARDLEYFIASACDGVVISPALGLSVDGLAANVLYFGEALDRVGVRVEVARRGAYKSAPDQFTRAMMSDEEYEALGAYLDTVYEVLVDGIAESRGLPRADVEKLIANGTSTSTEAKALRFVDEVLFPDEIEGHLRSIYGAPIRLVPAASVVSPIRRGWSAPPAIAVIHIDAAITGGTSRDLPFGFGQTAGAQTIVAALEAARVDPNVVGVVLRVDSPGGDTVASDLIARAVAKLDERKPVVASFGDKAASGGYYVAAKARAIFAEPTTLTGSIGVFSLHVSIEGLLRKLGISAESLLRGDRANGGSIVRDLSSGDRAVIEKDVETAYRRFLAVVAKGRSLDATVTRSLAEGRIWSGAAAKERGLVDALGGLVDAIEKVRTEAGLTPMQEVEIRTLPATRLGLPEPLRIIGEAMDASSNGLNGTVDMVGEGDAPSLAHLLPHGVRRAVGMVAPFVVGEEAIRPVALLPYLVAVD